MSLDFQFQVAHLDFYLLDQLSDNSPSHLPPASAFFYFMYVLLYPVYCNLGTMKMGNSGTYACLSPRVIQRADRFGLSLVEFNKVPSVNIWFEADVTSNPGANLTAVQIQLSFKTQYTMKYGYQVLVVGYLPQNNWLDIVNFKLPNDPALNPLYYASTTLNLTTDYVINFPSSITILASHNGWVEFTSSFGTDLISPGTITDFGIARLSTSTSTALTFRITATKYTGLKTMTTGILLFDNTVRPTKYYPLFTIQNFDFNLNLLLFNTTTAPYGIPFNEKCLISIRVWTYQSEFVLELLNSTYNNYYSMSVTPKLSSSLKGRFRFTCIVDTSLLDCDQKVFQDPYTGGCYTTGALCPVPTITVKSEKNWCPKCLQPQCLNCDVADRTICFLCNSTNFIELDTFSNTCKCLSGYGNTSLGLCTHCFIPFSYCLTCIFPNSQYDQTEKKCICQKGYYLDPIDNLCKGKCGDAIKIFDEGCDDGNFFNGDGCNDQCQEELNFKCSQNSALKSICAFSQDITITLDKILKVKNQNKAQLYFIVSPTPSALLNIDWKSTLSFAFPDSIKAPFIEITYNQGILTVTLAYVQDIQNDTCEIKVRFNQSIIDSTPTNLDFKLLGSNDKLTYQSSSLLENQKIVSAASFIVGITALLCFLVSSYFHKMIGLETLQFIQVIYFTRIIFSNNSESNVLAFNSLKYSNGYSEIGLSGPNSSNEFKSIPQFLMKIQLDMYYLQNCNLMVVPILFATGAYVYYFIQSSKAYSLYMKTKDILRKDQYIALKRKLSWVYDNFIFSFSLSLLYLTVFQMLVYELSSDLSSQDSETHLFGKFSFGLSLIILFYIFSIYCAEIIQGIKGYFDSLNNKENHFGGQKETIHQTSTEYHPLYAPFYLLYQKVIIILINSVILGFQYLTQTFTGITIIYLMLFAFWRPYSLRIHNVTNIYNQTVVVLFLFQEILGKYNFLNETMKILSIYLTIALIIGALIIQIVRLYVYRKSIKTEFKIEKKQRTKKPSELDPLKVNAYSYQAQVQKQCCKQNLKRSQLIQISDSSIYEREMFRKRLRYQNMMETQMNENTEVLQGKQMLKMIKDKIKRELRAN